MRLVTKPVVDRDEVFTCDQVPEGRCLLRPDPDRAEMIVERNRRVDDGDPSLSRGIDDAACLRYDRPKICAPMGCSGRVKALVRSTTRTQGLVPSVSRPPSAAA